MFHSLTKMQDQFNEMYFAVLDSIYDIYTHSRQAIAGRTDVTSLYTAISRSILTAIISLCDDQRWNRRTSLILITIATGAVNINSTKFGSIPSLF